jgi:hypothetical protein
VFPPRVDLVTSFQQKLPSGGPTSPSAEAIAAAAFSVDVARRQTLREQDLTARAAAAEDRVAALEGELSELRCNSSILAEPFFTPSPTQEILTQFGE